MFSDFRDSYRINQACKLFFFRKSEFWIKKMPILHKLLNQELLNYLLVPMFIYMFSYLFLSLRFPRRLTQYETSKAIQSAVAFVRTGLSLYRVSPLHTQHCGGAAHCTPCSSPLYKVRPVLQCTAEEGHTFIPISTVGEEEQIW